MILYIAINVPNIYALSGSITLYILPFAYFYIIKNNKVSLYFRLFKKQILFLLLLSLYCLLLDGVSGSEVYFINSLYYIVDLFPISFYLVILFFNIYNKNKLSVFSFQKIIIYVSAISGLISIALFMLPELNDYIRTNFLRTDDKIFNYTYRSFGFASGLLFSYPVMQGLISALCLLYSRNNKIFIILFLFILVSVFFNARTGFIPIIFSLLLMFINFREYKSVISLLIFLFVFVVIYVYSSGLLEYIENTIEWIAGSYFAVLNKFIGTSYIEASSTFDSLDNMLFLPSNFLFGDQIYYFGSTLNASDIGYILQLNYGGIVLVVFFVLFWISIFADLFKFQDNSINGRLFFIVLVVTFILANYKGDLMVPSCIQRFTILYYVWMKFYYTKIANHNMIVA